MNEYCIVVMVRANVTPGIRSDVFNPGIMRRFNVVARDRVAARRMMLDYVYGCGLLVNNVVDEVCVSKKI